MNQDRTIYKEQGVVDEKFSDAKILKKEKSHDVRFLRILQGNNS
jgi:hypothetical protein